MPQSKQEKKVHTLRKKPKKLTGVDLKLTSASKRLEDSIKKKHTDDKGRFTQKNPRTNTKEKIILDEISKFENLENKFVLRGDSKIDGRPVTKVITVKVK